MHLNALLDDNSLPTCRAGDLAAQTPAQQWLIQSLWPRGAVGILGGHPKSCKSWLGLEVAIAVASGKPCLGHFAVDAAGPVLVYLAEDSLPMVRARLVSLTEARGLALATLDLHVITSPALRLDQEGDRARLEVTIQRLHPRLLVLDPLVRLHRLDENNAQEMSGLLGHLRELQRRHELAIVLVHHARKRTAASPGESLRGSSDLYAWTDVTAYMGRSGEDHLKLCVEHRSASSPDPILLKLVSRSDGTATHLELLEKPKTLERALPRTLAQRVLLALRTSSPETPVSTEGLREQLKVQKQRLLATLADLEQQGAIARSPNRGGWLTTTPSPTTTEPSSTQARLPGIDN